MNCPACYRRMRDNAIICRDCWLGLPLALRSALPFRSSEPDYERVAKACRYYAILNRDQIEPTIPPRGIKKYIKAYPFGNPNERLWKEKQRILAEIGIKETA